MPPQPNSPSSVCGARTRTRFQPVTSGILSSRPAVERRTSGVVLSAHGSGCGRPRGARRPPGTRQRAPERCPGRFCATGRGRGAVRWLRAHGARDEHATCAWSRRASRARSPRSVAVPSAAARATARAGGGAVPAAAQHRCRPRGEHRSLGTAGPVASALPRARERSGGARLPAFARRSGPASATCAGASGVQPSSRLPPSR